MFWPNQLNFCLCLIRFLNKVLKKNHFFAHLHRVQSQSGKSKKLMTRSARSWDIFASYIFALLMGFSFTVLPFSADYVKQSHQCALIVQICGKATLYEQHTKKKEGNRKSIYWKMCDKSCQGVPRKIFNLLPDKTFCISKNMALFLYVFGREPCFWFFEQVISYAN